MIVEIRKLKRAYMPCMEGSEHGRTPYELTLKMEHMTNVKIWLCWDCLNKLKDEVDEAIEHLYEERGKAR